MNTQPVGLVLLLTVLLLGYRRAGAVQCIRRDGELVVRENGVDIPPGPFDCMRVKAVQKTVAETRLRRHTPDGAECSVRVRKQRSARTKFARSEMGTGTFCKYKCVEGKGYRCLYKMDRDGGCACEAEDARVVTVGVVGRGADALGETCDDKWEGYEFADAVACTRMRAGVEKERVVETGGGRCVRKVERIVETRFMRTEKMERNLEGCVYVCKRGLIKCLDEGSGRVCKCGRVGLRKVLVGMEEGEMEGRVDQTTCKGGDCGPCGVCVGGVCVLQRGASKGNICQCGEICPDVDRRRGGKGGKIFCEPNWQLSCRAAPKWMREDVQRGTSKPDLCREGTVDAADTCGCAKGYEEDLAKYGETKCREASSP